MRIGVYGGSFDPFHNGHLAIIRGALRCGLIEAVVVIPTVRNSFKRGRVLSAAPYRFYMTKDVLESEFKDEPVYLSDIEFSIEGISYTAITLERFCDKAYIVPFLMANGVKRKRAEEDHSYFWIAGSDILPQFDSWYMPDKILKYANLLAASRPGDGIDVDSEADRLEKIFDKRPEIFKIEQVEASSSVIRKERDFDKIPEAARRFIITHDLYQADNPLDHVSDRAVESFMEAAIWMYPYLGCKRLLHTLNVGLLSCRYALIHGCDPDKALLAGALHDCAKELDIDLQRRMAEERTGDIFVEKKLLHSPAGATFASREFGVDDPEILDAITYHTTGCGNMSLLSKIVFLADKLEPSRTYTDLTQMRITALRDLDEALRMCVGAVKDKFESQGRDIHPLTRDFMESLGL